MPKKPTFKKISGRKVRTWTIEKAWTYRRTPTLTSLYEDEVDCRVEACGEPVYRVRVVITELPTLGRARATASGNPKRRKVKRVR